METADAHRFTPIKACVPESVYRRASACIGGSSS